VLGADRNCSDVMISKGGGVAKMFESRSYIYRDKDQSEAFVVMRSGLWCSVSSDRAFTSLLVAS
jgi:hypothetical protein